MNRDMASIEREAREWIIRRNGDRHEDASDPRFGAWIANDANRKAYEQAQIDQSLIDAAAFEIAAAEAEESLRAFARAEKRCSAVGGFIRKVSLRLVGGLLAAGMATAAIIIIAPSISPTIDYATAIGEMRDVHLEDGSVARLNADTRIKVKFRRGARRIELAKGEAFFDVAHDKTRPFIVSSAFVDIRVTGTRFNVDLTRKSAEIGVAEGLIELSAKGERRDLSAGEAISVDDSRKFGVISRFDMQTAFSWRDGRAVFADVPLESVVEKLNRQFLEPFVIKEYGLRTRRVTMDVGTDDQAAVAEILATAMSANIERTERGWTIQSAESGPQ